MSNTNKLTLIISDVHCEWENADKIIKHVKADTVISLGDIFDSFTETADSIRESAEWFVDFVNNPNHIMLFGNHEQNYAFNYLCLHCSGYEQWKYFLIKDIVPRSVWDKLKWYHFLDNTWLLTHAGLHNDNVPRQIKTYSNDLPKFIAKLSKYLDHEIRRGLDKAANGAESWIFNAGYARCGNQKVGGITWCDHNTEMHPIIGLSQIYGHSPQSYNCPSWLIQDGPESKPYFKLNDNTKINFKNVNKSYNLCLDIWKNMHYALWNGKELSVHSIYDI